MKRTVQFSKRSNKVYKYITKDAGMEIDVKNNQFRFEDVNYAIQVVDELI